MNNIVNIWNKIREEYSNELYMTFDKENNKVFIKELDTDKIVKIYKVINL
jgi:hypothetical protein